VAVLPLFEDHVEWDDPMADLLFQLNPQQREAVEHMEGPLLILAGAGSGKTRVITFRIARLIESSRAPAAGILAVTFTNKAAAQMKQRVMDLLGGLGEGPGPQISTFHSFCVRVLRRDIHRLGYTRDFVIYDEDDQQRLVKSCLRELSLSDSVATPRATLARISSAKNRGISPQDMMRDATDPASERLASVFELYEKRLRQANALDFDDLLLKAVQLLHAAPDVAAWYNRHFHHMMVDEFQDTNRIQYLLIRLLTMERQNLCVVGDEDQSIYSWRGADIQNILSFKKDFPEARLIRLEQNYRSTQMILDAAGAVVENNRARIGKTLWSSRHDGTKLGLFQAEDADEEAAFVAARLAEDLAAEPQATAAVLYRTNAQSRLFEEALRRQNIAYRVVGGFRFYERAEVKDVLAYARLANNPLDSMSLLRIINTPARGIGAATVGLLQAAAASRNRTLWEALDETLREATWSGRALLALQGFQNLVLELIKDRSEMPPGEFFKSILDRSRYIEALEKENLPEAESRIENLLELVSAAREAEERGETLAEFLDHASLVSDSDQYDENFRVTLMTLHTAKGLEFSTVYLVGLEEGLFPHKMSLREPAAIEEERRLCYVGMTRAKDRLTLTYASSRRFYGAEGYEGTRPSRFLAEIPEHLVEELPGFQIRRKAAVLWDDAANSIENIEEFLEKRGVAKAPRRSSSGLSFDVPRPRHCGRWKLGAQVRHPKYGLGTVVACEGEGEDSKLTVSFPGYGRKKLVERYASLERI
jgi:DNA helicase-2/ATP-dependent DNA helicase PcrA